MCFKGLSLKPLGRNFLVVGTKSDMQHNNNENIIKYMAAEFTERGKISVAGVCDCCPNSFRSFA